MPPRNATKEPATESVSLDLVKRAMLDRSVKLTMADEDPEVVQRRMIEDVFGATSVEEVLAGSGTALHAEDVVGRNFTLTRVEFRNSEEEQGLPIFAVMHAVFTDTGEQNVITCGATGVVPRLIKLIELDALPIDVRLRTAQTKSGRRVFDLEAASDF